MEIIRQWKERMGERQYPAHTERISENFRQTVRTVQSSNNELSPLLSWKPPDIERQVQDPRAERDHVVW